MYSTHCHERLSGLRRTFFFFKRVLQYKYYSYIWFRRDAIDGVQKIYIVLYAKSL